MIDLKNQRQLFNKKKFEVFCAMLIAPVRFFPSGWKEERHIFDYPARFFLIVIVRLETVCDISRFLYAISFASRLSSLNVKEKPGADLVQMNRKSWNIWTL